MCCGNKRNALKAGGNVLKGGGVQRSDMVVLEYTGVVPLELTGSFTGKKYHFKAGGPVLQADCRDARTLLSLPGVRMIAGRL